MDTNHILLPNSYYEIQNSIMNISLNILINTTYMKHIYELGERNRLSLNNYQNNSIFIDNNPTLFSLSSSYLNVKASRLLVNSPFWSFIHFQNNHIVLSLVLIQ